MLCSLEAVDTLREVLLVETGSLGCRTQTVRKHALSRSFDQIQLRGFPVRMKIGPHTAKPEFDDLAMIAASCDVPIRRLGEEALSAWTARETERSAPGDRTERDNSGPQAADSTP